MRALRDTAAIIALQIGTLFLWAASKVGVMRDGYLWDDERYKMPNWNGEN